MHCRTKLKIVNYFIPYLKLNNNGQPVLKTRSDFSEKRERLKSVVAELRNFSAAYSSLLSAAFR